MATNPFFNGFLWTIRVHTIKSPTSLSSTQLITRGVSHRGLAIYIKKNLKAKEELCKLKYNFQKSSKKTKTSSSYYNSIITNLKFQHKPKYHLSKLLILR
jgi:hypothetical protein